MANAFGGALNIFVDDGYEVELPLKKTVRVVAAQIRQIEYQLDELADDMERRTE